MKPCHLRHVRPDIRHDQHHGSSALEAGNVNTLEGMDAATELAHARYTARVTGGMWTWEGEKLVRITAPNVERVQSRDEHVRELAARLNPDGLPCPDLCCIPGCWHTREVRRVICRDHTRRWTRDGKPPLHIWLAQQIAAAKGHKIGGAA